MYRIAKYRLSLVLNRRLGLVTAATFCTHPICRPQFGPDFSPARQVGFGDLLVDRGRKLGLVARLAHTSKSRPPSLHYSLPSRILPHDCLSGFSQRVFQLRIGLHNKVFCKHAILSLMGSTAACKVPFCVPSSSTNGLRPWPRVIPGKRKDPLQVHLQCLSQHSVGRGDCYY